MSEQETVSGHCLCTAVRLHARLPESGLTACHCGQCRRWTGGGPLYALRAKDVVIEDEAAVRVYRASEHGERVFCGTCGTTLFWRMQGHPVTFLSPGLFGDRQGLKVTEEIFVDRRPDWIAPVPGAVQSTEAEQQAQLAAFLSKADPS